MGLALVNGAGVARACDCSRFVGGGRAVRGATGQGRIMNIIKISAMPNSKKKAKKLAISGLPTDGGHHKQWYLEEILKALGCDLDCVRIELQQDDYDWEPGIPP